MDPKDYPTSCTSGPASTDDCKALLALIPASAHPDGKAGGWKRKSKTGSGERIERLFLSESGLAALVVQTPGLLAVEMVKPSFVEIEMAVRARVASHPKSFKPATLQARAEPSLAKRVKAIIDACKENDEDEDQDDYIKLMNEAGATPSGSPLRVAVGNLFMFDLPPKDCDEPYLEIWAKGGFPSTDQPHWLENLSHHFESPNESCTHLVDLEPCACIEFMLSNGFEHNPKQDMSFVHSDWAGPMIARTEAMALDKAAGPGAKSAPQRGL